MQYEYKTISVPPIAGRVWKAIALTVGILSFASCLKPSEILQPRIQGSVFIVKADGDSVRLGLTTVYLVPSAEATDGVRASVNKHINTLRNVDLNIAHIKKTSPESIITIGHFMTLGETATSDLAKVLSLISAAAIDQTKTDADGEFELLIPANIDTSIVAYATRKIGEQSEHYFWIVPSSEALKQKPKLFLSNDNQSIEKSTL